MTHDPIIEEIRSIRDGIAKESGYDIDEIFETYRQLEQQDELNGRIVIARPRRDSLESTLVPETR